MKKGQFTIREAEYVRNNYLTQTDLEIAQHLERTEESVKKFRTRQLELSKPACKITRAKTKKAPNTTDRFICYSKNVPYRFVKIANEWVKEQKVKWEAQNGPIPAGSFLRCKTKDTLNTDPSNWQLVTRKKQAQLNKNPEAQAQSLKKTWSKVKTMEANGLKPRCGLKSRYKKPVPKQEIFVLHNLNTHTDMHF